MSAFLRRVGEVRFALVMSERGGVASAGESSAATTPMLSPEAGKGGGGFDWERRRGTRPGTGTTAGK